MPYFMVTDIGEGTCSVCGYWGEHMLNAAVRTAKGPAVIGTEEGVPREACKDCVETMVNQVIEESQKQHGHDPNGPLPGQKPA